MPSATQKQSSEYGPADVASAAAAQAAIPPPAPEPREHASPKQSKSRTTIPTQSGKWILGKTIGAGSMGKVKLARKEESGEQVGHPSCPCVLCP